MKSFLQTLKYIANISFRNIGLLKAICNLLLVIFIPYLAIHFPAINNFFVAYYLYILAAFIFSLIVLYKIALHSRALEESKLEVTIFDKHQSGNPYKVSRASSTGGNTKQIFLKIQNTSGVCIKNTEIVLETITYKPCSPTNIPEAFMRDKIFMDFFNRAETITIDKPIFFDEGRSVSINPSDWKSVYLGDWTTNMSPEGYALTLLADKSLVISPEIKLYIKISAENMYAQNYELPIDTTSSKDNLTLRLGELKKI